jgi:hypothetical protein
MSNIKHQIKFMQGILDQREENNPIKVRMHRMTQGESDKEIAALKEIMESLRWVKEYEQRPPEPKIEVEVPREDIPAMSVDKVARLESAVAAIHLTAKNNSEMCQHCQSIANLLGEMGSVVQ